VGICTMNAPVLYIISSCAILGVIGSAVLWYLVRRRRR
jgi:hypothetical protein